ncbi:hypothetical protein [Methanosarcina horonobensis]|nr:hypothetical protein [Methanosarcina horonobensis]
MIMDQMIYDEILRHEGEMRIDFIEDFTGERAEMYMNLYISPGRPHKET